jgi:hypothetical protein
LKASFVQGEVAVFLRIAPLVIVALGLVAPAGAQESPASAGPTLLARMKAAGITVETPGGEPVSLGDGHRGALVRSPDGLLVELVE